MRSLMPTPSDSPTRKGLVKRVVVPCPTQQIVRGQSDCRSVVTWRCWHAPFNVCTLKYDKAQRTGESRKQSSQIFYYESEGWTVAGWKINSNSQPKHSVFIAQTHPQLHTAEMLRSRHAETSPSGCDQYSRLFRVMLTFESKKSSMELSAHLIEHPQCAIGELTLCTTSPVNPNEQFETLAVFYLSELSKQRTDVFHAWKYLWRTAQSI